MDREPYVCVLVYQLNGKLDIVSTFCVVRTTFNQSARRGGQRSAGRRTDLDEILFQIIICQLKYRDDGYQRIGQYFLHTESALFSSHCFWKQQVRKFWDDVTTPP